MRPAALSGRRAFCFSSSACECAKRLATGMDARLAAGSSGSFPYGMGFHQPGMERAKGTVMKTNPFQYPFGIATALLVCCTALPASAQKPSEESGVTLTADQMKKADESFLQQAHSGTMLHIMASKYALEQVKSPEVRKLAEMLIADHEKGDKMLMEVASKEGIKLPSELLPPQRAMLDQAMTVKGEQFVTTYLINMTTLHVHDILAFSNAAAKSKNNAVSGLAKEMLPKLKAHYAMIRPMAASEVELKDGL
ncbi:MAG: DUF4142 domain-containing protein [Verrucomicrobiaceae bacterium]|nr:MAG: DUF4142 domain-containing protein [Verrucomicrobiaceae bacterium]